MAEVLEIPITTDEPSFKIRTILEGTEVVLRFDYNTRLQKYHISVFDASENPLILGHALNIDTEIFSRFEIVGLPPGNLMLYDSSNKHIEAAVGDLGDRCKLLYLTSV